MKIRIGYVTNSSSTNFLILSRKELTSEYLFNKLGFKKNSPIEDEAMELCENILYGTENGLRWFNYSEINYDHIKEVFGEKAAKKFDEIVGKSYFTYWGYTNSDDGTLTSFFTTDSFEIDQKGFYVNGRNCVW